MAPVLQQSPICSGAVKVFWDQPTVTNGADVKQAMVCFELFLLPSLGYTDHYLSCESGDS